MTPRRFAYLTLPALAACAPESVDAVQTTQALPVKVQQVAPESSYQQLRTLSGELRHRRQTQLGFEVPGRLREVLVTRGAAVTKGQVLARLDDRRAVQTLAAAGAARRQAESRLQELREGPRRETIAQAAAAVLELQKEVRLAELKLRRAERLREEEVASQDDLDEAQTRLESLQARLTQAQQRLDELRNGTRKELLAAQEALVARLQAEQELARIAVEDCQLQAPFAGRVAARLLDPGAVLQAGTPVLDLVESGSMQAWIGVPASLRAAVEGTDGLRLQVGGQEIPLTTPRKLPRLDPETRSHTFIFDLPGDADQLHAGEVVRLQVPVVVQQTGTWLPMAALSESARGLWSCFVCIPEDGSDTAVLRRAEVQVLHQTSDRVFVTGTLRAGDLVVLRGTHRVVPGQRVHPQQEN